jgi:hypothetical protein
MQCRNGGRSERSSGDGSTVAATVRQRVATRGDNAAVPIAQTTPALQIHAGPRALALLRDRPLQPSDVAAIPAAAGGPKGLVLNALDRTLFGHWLVPGSGLRDTVHLLGASIGAWRMAVACLPESDAGFAQLAHDYIHQSYEHAPGKAPTPQHVSQRFGAKLHERFGGREAQVLAHPHFRLHVIVARGRHVLRREGRWGSRVTTPLGYLGAFAANALHRKALGAWLERVVLSDPRDALPLPLTDFRSRVVPLSASNLQPGLLASCTIPFWLEAVRDLPGAPRGAYWDGGLTDYHLHLRYDALADGLVLYPHFQPTIVPGWLDKALKHRHRATRALDNVVVLSPSPAWIASLPGGKLPDRSDFKTHVDDDARRVALWSRAVAEAQRLADEFREWVDGRRRLPIEPLR